MSTAKNVFGGLFVGCGVLIAGTAGGCLLIVWSLSRDTAFNMSDISFLIGPTLVGLAMVGLGLFMLLKKSAASPPGANPGQPAVPPEQIRRAAPPADSDSTTE